MFSRKYQIDSATSLIEQVQVERQKKLEKELIEYEKKYKEYWKPFHENLKRYGLSRDTVMSTLVITGGITSFFSQEVTILCMALFFSYLVLIELATKLYAGNGPEPSRPLIPAIKISKENLAELSKYFNQEQKAEIKKTLEDFKIDWNIDIDELKVLLNKISEQIDKNNSTALLPPPRIEIEKFVSWYRPTENEMHHNTSHAYS